MALIVFLQPEGVVRKIIDIKTLNPARDGVGEFNIKGTAVNTHTKKIVW